jgi:hypothetical protein
VRFLIVSWCVLALVSTSRVEAGVTSITPLRDNTLFQDAQGDTSNGSGPAFFAGNNGQNLVHRALLAFDIAGQIPAGSVVDSVVLTLQVSSSPETVPRTIALHRVLADWGEGSSYSAGGSGAPATPGDATWLHAFYPDQAWLTPGGDFDPAASAMQAVGDVGTYEWTGPGLAADVQRWLDHPVTNFGWLLQGDETRGRTVRRFDSREAALSGEPPLLTIYYSAAVVAARAASWGSLKTRYRRE